MKEIPQQTAEPKKSTYKSSKVPYSRGDIKNGYVNKFKKDEIAKWTELMLKHGVIKMEGLNTNS
jgi:SET domain-containing protein